MYRKSCYTAAILLVLLKYSDSQITMKGCSDPVKGQFCRLICCTADYMRNIFFRKSSTGDFQGTCAPNGGSCSSAVYDIHQSSGSVFETYLDISSLNYTVENDTWVCLYGISTSSNGVSIVVHTVPSNVTIELETNATPQTILGRGHCVYPNDVVMKLIYQEDEGQEEELGIFSISNSTKGVLECEEHEYQVTGSYELTQSQISSTLNGKSVRFKTRITVADLSSSQESEWTSKVDYPGPTKPKPDPPSSGWELWYTLVIVIGCVVMMGIVLAIGIKHCRKKNKRHLDVEIHTSIESAKRAV